MNEKETNLIREYVHIQYLIKEAVTVIGGLKSSKITLRGMLEICTKALGRKLKEKSQSVQKELRTAGIHVWIEDDGGEIVFVGTAKNGVKGKHGIKRRILQEDMINALDVLLEEFIDKDAIMAIPYTIPVSRGDPYANTYK